MAINKERVAVEKSNKFKTPYAASDKSVTNQSWLFGIRRIINLYKILGLKRLLLVFAPIISVVLVTGIVLWIFLNSNAAIIDPFTPQVASSVQYPLYYPTYLPNGYHIDANSVKLPQAGVVTFNIVGSNNSIAYVSEVARPEKFDLGGFYQSLSHLQEVGVSDGAIAVGWLHNGHNEIASRANNKTWILVNTTTKIPASDLIKMMKSLIAND